MKLLNVRQLKSWTYKYENVKEKEEHRKIMIQALFQVEKESYLSIEFSQVIKEIEKEGILK